MNDYTIFVFCNSFSSCHRNKVYIINDAKHRDNCSDYLFLSALCNSLNICKTFFTFNAAEFVFKVFKNKPNRF